MSDIIEPAEPLTTDAIGASQAVDRFLAQLDDALSRNDIGAVAALFTPDCHWRDLVAFTWNLKTVEGPDAGKRCIVVGSSNSAHDICADLWEHGADVTMIQRSSTMIARVDSLFELTTANLCSEQALKTGIDTEKADLLSASVPYRLMGEFQRPAYEKMRERDGEFYDRLRRVGFLLDFGDDETGLFMKYVRRGSGYYIDVGASYGPMNGWADELINQQVADRVGKCWGYGSETTKDPGPFEGDLRNMWKPTHQEGLWFHGGNLHQSRFHSLHFALQLKARLEEMFTPVYGIEPVHHLF